MICTPTYVDTEKVELWKGRLPPRLHIFLENFFGTCEAHEPAVNYLNYLNDIRLYGLTTRALIESIRLNCAGCSTISRVGFLPGMVSNTPTHIDEAQLKSWRERFPEKLQLFLDEDFRTLPLERDLIKNAAYPFGETSPAGGRGESESDA